METTSNFPVMLENKMCGDMNAKSYVMEISNTIFDLAEDELPPLDIDGNEIDKSYINGLSSFLLESPKKDVKCDSVVSTKHQGPRYSKLSFLFMICKFDDFFSFFFLYLMVIQNVSDGKLSKRTCGKFNRSAMIIFYIFIILIHIHSLYLMYYLLSNLLLQTEAVAKRASTLDGSDISDI